MIVLRIASKNSASLSLMAAIVSIYILPARDIVRMAMEYVCSLLITKGEPTKPNTLIRGRIVANFPNDKQILTAASQILEQYNGDVLNAKLHAARLNEKFLKEGDVGGHLTWLRIHRAILELTDAEHDGEVIH